MKPRIILKLHNFDPKTTFVLIGKEYNFASIVDFNSLGVLRKILGNVNFSYSLITDLGNLTTIGGRANFTYSEITDLANLTTIEGSVNFKWGKVIDLGNLQTIGGDAFFGDSPITNLANLTTIGGNAYFNLSDINDLGKLQIIGGYANFLHSKVKSLGNLTSIGRDADFNGSAIKDLGKLQIIGGYADFSFSKITDLGSLETIEGNVDFEDSKVKYLGNLKRIGGNANFTESQITDLGNLTTIGGKGIFLKSKVENLGNLQNIGGNASFVGSKIKDLGILTTIGGDAVFGESPITDLGNLTTIGGDAYFEESKITDLGNLTTIGGNAYFQASKIMDLGNLTTIVGSAFFGDREDLKEEWERRQNKYKKGGRTISQTPAPKKDQIKGSDKNKAGSSKDTESAKQIKFNEKTLNSIQNKIDEHNKQYPNKKITLESAKAVVRRGMGAYSQTYRPTISGGKPNSRVAWGLARLNAFIYKIINGKSKSGKYSQDNDLIEELGYKVEKYEIGGIFQGTPHDFDKYSTEYMGTGEGLQAFGWGLYFTNIKDIAKNYAKNEMLIQKEISRKSDNSAHLWIYTNISDNVVDKLGYLKIKLKEFEELKNEYKKDTWDDKIETYSTLIDIIQNYQGKIYSVTLFKGENESDYDLLEWEKKPKKSQLDLIKKQLDKEGIIVSRDLGMGKDNRFKGESLYKILEEQETSYTGGTKNNNLYTELSAFLGGDKEASLFLLRAGIDGIKYKAGTLSGMEDEEGYNYVIFNADDVTIEGKEKYADGGVLLAPNGKPSNLTPEQYELVRTPAFKKWFGDWENDPENASKVVDENGEPKVVWRGESKDFNKFDYKKLGSRLKTAWRKAGFYFAPTKSSAEQYMFFMGTRILKEFFLNIRNPYTLDSNEFYGVMDWGSLPNQRFKTNKSATDYANSQVEIIKSKNHDGFFVTILEDDNIVEIVAFEPNQIKLADGSNTTFDSNNSDIRFDGGGGIEKIKFDIEEDDEEQRITISIKNIGEVILVVSYPEYEFLEDIGEHGLEELGVEEGDMIGKIEHLEIEDKYKGQGYAKLLMNKAIEIATEKGLMPLYLNASPMGSDGLDIDALTIFYEKLGFQVFLEQGGNNLMILKETYNNGGLIKRRSRKRNQ